MKNAILVRTPSVKTDDDDCDDNDDDGDDDDDKYLSKNLQNP